MGAFSVQLLLPTLFLYFFSTVAALEGYDVPKYTITPLKNESVIYRQDVCDRHEEFYNGTVTLKDALDGMQLRPYFVTGLGDLSPVKNNDGTIPRDSLEPAIRILDILAGRAGFTWRKSYGASGLPTSSTEDGDGNGNGNGEDDKNNSPSINEVLKWSAETFDLVAMNIVKTQDRSSNGNSFLEGNIDSSIVMVGVSGSKSSLGLLTFLSPFDWQVWLLTLFTMVIAAMGYQWMEWINNGDSDRQNLSNKPAENLYYAAMAFTGDCKYEPQTNYARLFVLSLAFWGLILSSAYTANLASFLVAQNTPVLLVETVGDAVAANYPLCVVAGAAPATEIRNTYPQANLVSVPPERQHEIFTKVLSKECTLAVTTMYEWDLAKHDGELNPDCELQWIGRTFKFAKSGFVTLSDSGTLCSNLIRDVLSVHISEMHDDGTIQGVLDDYSKSRKSNTCSDDGAAGDSDSSSGSNGDDVQALSMQDLGGLFIVVYVIWFIACMIALISWFFRKRKERGEKKKDVTKGDANTDDNIDQLRLKETNDRSLNSQDPESNATEKFSVAVNQSERDQLAYKLGTMRQQMDEMQTLLQKNVY